MAEAIRAGGAGIGGFFTPSAAGTVIAKDKEVRQLNGVDQVFVAALLTIIGYSINDTVIIFDRIREYINYGSLKGQEVIFNTAINHTLSRTVITSGATLLVVIVLLIFGGEVMRGFSFALLVGIAIGTYSSIFIAAPIIIDFDKPKPADVKVKA